MENPEVAQFFAIAMIMAIGTIGPAVSIGWIGSKAILF